MKVPRPTQLLRRPLRLPRLRPQAKNPDDPRIFTFNDERDDVLRDVVERVVRRHGADPQHLRLTLNETAHLEVERLEKQRDAEAREELDDWRSLMRRVSRLSETEMAESLGRIAGAMAGDVAGSFDPRVYKTAQSIVPSVITGAMRPTALAKRAFTGGGPDMSRIINVQGSTERVASLAKKGTVVLVPTHSSNLDSLAIGECLHRHGLPPMVYGAGKNLFTNPIVSFFMHNLGAYRVDRRVKARLYKDVLKTYSTVMLERGYHSLFFPGGTRSRSGLVERKLKLGLAGTAHQAFANTAVLGRPQRIFFVPVTINYTLVLEAETLAEDFLKEQGKARYIIEDDEFSRIDRWVAFFGKVTGQEGACILRFGEPLDPFANPVDENGDSLTPQGRPFDPVGYVMRDGKPIADSVRDGAYARMLADELVARYERDTVLMSTNLVAHVVYRHLVRSTPELDLLGRMRRRGELVMPRDELIRELGEVRDAVVTLSNAGRVRLSLFCRDQDPEVLLARALSTWSYHNRLPVHDLGPELVAEDPMLLMYYQNRMADLALDIAAEMGDEASMPAAREIHDLSVAAGGRA